MHIPANYCCDSWAVLLDTTRDLCIILFMCSLSKLSHELYLHLHMCSLLYRFLLYLLYMCSLLKCDYLFCNYSLSLFVILPLELHVYIMLTFMFCEINDIYIYIAYKLTKFQAKSDFIVAKNTTMSCVWKWHMRCLKWIFWRKYWLLQWNITVLTCETVKIDMIFSLIIKLADVYSSVASIASLAAPCGLVHIFITTWP